MKRYDQLTIAELRTIVRQIHEFFYYNAEKRQWDADRDISGADLVDAVAQAFRDADMVPSGTAPVIASFRGTYAFLSNFFSSLIHVSFPGCERIVQTLEHAYQASKANTPTDFNRICDSKSPGLAKRAGKAIQLRHNWDDMKLEIMEKLLCQKFADPKLRAALVATGEADLIEGNRWGDRYWGCTWEAGSWVGENHLGRLLMKIRDSLKEEMHS